MPSLLLIGLAPLPASADPPATPAIIVHPDAASRGELEHVISGALGGMAITLADDALTQTPRLSLEHTLRRDPAGGILNGRDRSRPEVFELVRRGARCLLVRSSTGRVWRLRHTTCAALPRP